MSSDISMTDHGRKGKAPQKPSDPPNKRAKSPSQSTSSLSSYLSSMTQSTTSTTQKDDQFVMVDRSDKQTRHLQATLDDNYGFNSSQDSQMDHESSTINNDRAAENLNSNNHNTNLHQAQPNKTLEQSNISSNTPTREEQSTPRYMIRQQTSLLSSLRNSPNPRPPQTQITRFQLVMNVSRAQDGQITKYVRNRLLKVMSFIQTFDPFASIAPWAIADRDEYDPIHDFSATALIPLPEVVTKLSKYLAAYRIPLRSAKQEIWSKICISHSVPISDLLQNTQEILIHEEWRLQVCRMQVEQSKVIGWLLYSCRHFQEDTKLSLILTALFRHEVVLFWRKISGTENHYALHIEVESCYQRAASTFFANLYGSNSNSKLWPLGIKMSVIPEMTFLTEKKMERCKKLAFRQALFCQEIQTGTIHSIISSHDSIVNDSEVSNRLNLRQAILNITLPKMDPKVEDKPVFHSVTLNRKNETVVTFFKHTNAYARMIVASPLTFLKYFHNPQLVENCFSEAEIEKSSSEKMDKDTLEVETTETQLIDSAFFEDGYGGINQADVEAFSLQISQSKKIEISNVPLHLKSYHKKYRSSDSVRSDDFMSVDFRPDAQACDVDSISADSRSTNIMNIRDIQAITAQVYAYMNQPKSSMTPPAPTPAATSTAPSVRFKEGTPPGGQGR